METLIKQQPRGCFDERPSATNPTGAGGAKDRRASALCGVGKEMGTESCRQPPQPQSCTCSSHVALRPLPYAHTSSLSGQNKRSRTPPQQGHLRGGGGSRSGQPRRPAVLQGPAGTHCRRPASTPAPQPGGCGTAGSGPPPRGASGRTGRAPQLGRAPVAGGNGRRQPCAAAAPRGRIGASRAARPPQAARSTSPAERRLPPLLPAASAMSPPRRARRLRPAAPRPRAGEAATSHPRR